MDVIVPRPEGLYCPTGDFYIDPWKPVARAVITHAHGDHARTGSGHYWCAQAGLAVMRERLGRGSAITPLAYGTPVRMGGTAVSLHPAGHILGSSQVRVESAGETWVVSGDYKRNPDPTCAAFEPQRCDVFITEATFALPVYAWPEPAAVAAEIHAWWQANAAAGRASVLFCYALGKAQRILAELTHHTDQTVYLHGAMSGLVAAYRSAGVHMLPTQTVSEMPRDTRFAEALVLAPPGAGGTPWMRRFTPFSTGFASGWMRVRGNRRRRNYDRGFVLSDHADWGGLLRTIEETGARRVLATHGHSDALVAQLRAKGVDAQALKTAFEGETDQ